MGAEECAQYSSFDLIRWSVLISDSLAGNDVIIYLFHVYTEINIFSLNFERTYRLIKNRFLKTVGGRHIVSIFTTFRVSYIGYIWPVWCIQYIHANAFSHVLNLPRQPFSCWFHYFFVHKFYKINTRYGLFDSAYVMKDTT